MRSIETLAKDFGGTYQNYIETCLQVMDENSPEVLIGTVMKACEENPGSVDRAFLAGVMVGYAYSQIDHRNKSQAV